jgi:hypothetical protein
VVNQELGRLAIEIVNAGRRWAAARGLCRRLLDSKKASPHEVATAQKVYIKTSDEMEALVRRLEGAMQLSGLVVPMNKRARPFPWRPIISMAADFTKALEAAVNADKHPVIDAEVIEVIAEK